MELEVEKALGIMLYNIHLLMMFQGKIKELCQDLDNTMGFINIDDYFLIDVEFKNESFVLKSLKCLSRFKNPEYSARVPQTL